MTLREYYDALSSFDWDYAYSDDHSIFRQGEQRWRSLQGASETSKRHKALWDSFQKWRTGVINGKPKRPRNA